MKTVFFDVDTQIDFVYPAGALYVPGAEHIVPHIARLNRWAGAHGFPVVSTTDAHTENDPEFSAWPPHCIAGTLSQRKPLETLIEKQIIIEKQALDCFTNPDLPAILKGLAAERYVVYGVVTEYCVRFAAFGLLATGARVELVTDAVKGLKKADSDRTLSEFTAAGGVLTTLEQVCAG
jgi:nicotinamidase/pyrazinamidase